MYEGKINNKLTSGWINNRPKEKIIKYNLIDTETLKGLIRLIKFFNQKQN